MVLVEEWIPVSAIEIIHHLHGPLVKTPTSSLCLFASLYPYHSGMRKSECIGGKSVKIHQEIESWIPNATQCWFFWSKYDNKCLEQMKMAHPSPHSQEKDVSFHKEHHHHHHILAFVLRKNLRKIELYSTLFWPIFKDLHTNKKVSTLSSHAFLSRISICIQNFTVQTVSDPCNMANLRANMWKKDVKTGCHSICKPLAHLSMRLY